jgi:hypothetical protein
LELSINFIGQSRKRVIEARMATKEIVRAVLDLPSYLDSYWDVVAVYPKENTGLDPQLALAHYGERFNPNIRRHAPLRHVRGVIVDLKNRNVVCQNVGYTEPVPIYSDLVNNGTSYSFDSQVRVYQTTEDENPDEEPTYQPGRMVFTGSAALFLGTESVMVRVFRWNGITFFSNFKQIDGLTSSWAGNREKFGNTFERLTNGYKIADLFDDELYSPYVHTFILNDKSVRLSTSMRENRVVYIGATKVWEDGPDSQVSVVYNNGAVCPLKPFIPSVLEEPDTFSFVFDKPPMYQPKLSVDVANKIMFPMTKTTDVSKALAEAGGVEFGDRFQVGELVLKYDIVSDPNIGVRREVSDVYYKHPMYIPQDARLHGGDPIIVYTRSEDGHIMVYRLEPLSYMYRAAVTDNDPNPYHRFVTELYDFRRDIYDRGYPNYNFASEDLERVENRELYWLAIFVDAISPEFRDEAKGYLKMYHDDMEMVHRFIMNVYPNITPDNKDKFFKVLIQKRFTDLVQTARKVKGDFSSVLLSMLYNETSDSIYKMFSSIKNYNRNSGKPSRPRVPNLVQPVPVGMVQFGDMPLV